MPVILAPNQALPVVRRILHPTDLTVISERAFATAINFARQNDAVLFIVHALPPPTPIYEIESSLRPEAEKALRKLLQRADRLGVRAKRVLIKGSARVGNDIVKCARFFGVDLIVMGTRGSAGISRWLVGSHASRVIARAHCPVVVVRGRPARVHSSVRT